MAINSLGSVTNTITVGVTGQRPVVALPGTQFWNTDTNSLQVYTGTAWVDTATAWVETATALGDLAIQTLIGII